MQGGRAREVKCIKKRDCMEGFALSQHKWLVGALGTIHVLLLLLFFFWMRENQVDGVKLYTSP